MRKNYIYDMVATSKEGRDRGLRRYNDMRHSKRKYKIAINHSHGFVRDMIIDEYAIMPSKMSKGSIERNRKNNCRSFNEMKCEEGWKIDLNLGLLEVYQSNAGNEFFGI